MFGLFKRPLAARLTHRLFFHSKSLPASCPSCHTPLPSALPACTNCWTISNVPENVTHHQLFALPYDPNPFSVNLPLLRRRFLRAQTTCHPDAWSSKGPHKQDIAQDISSRLNGAYQSLLNPLSRAEYILELNQLPMSESDQVNDMAFMSHVMEARETIEGGENEIEIVTLAEENDARINETVAEIERLVGEQNWVRVKEETIRLRYLEGIRRAVNKWLDNQ
ncbi:hypothetical protein F5887DRAFT_877382 [Amanita rubescens]|nr:hypothetical protein F5887DRAFT_877382 [Amanita rubescens]